VIRQTFDQAAGCIEDGSVDLLHIDGLHTFAAVQSDYETWLPKLSDRAVVMFHDINERSGDFGVWRLWQALREQHGSFAFLHGHGLGVLAVGANAPEPVRALCGIDEPRQVAAVRSRFARIGERWLAETRERMLSERFGTAAAAEEAREARLRDVTHALEASEQALAEEARRAKDAQTAAAQARADAAEARLEVSRQVAVERARVGTAEQARIDALREADVMRTRMEATRHEVRQAQIDAARLVEAEVARMDAARVAETELARADAERVFEAERARLEAERLIEAERAVAAQALRQARTLEAALAVAKAEVQRSSRYVEAMTFERNTILSSTAWRLTWPLRRAGQLMPGWLRRGFRLGAKFTWWSVTLKLPSKLAQRRRLLVRLDNLLPRAPVIPAPILSAAELQAETQEFGPIDPSATRLLYISGEYQTAGHTYRVERFVETARGMGMAAAFMRIDEIGARYAEISHATILVLWRAAWSADLERAVATAWRSGARIVFDVDDLMIDPGFARADFIDAIRSNSLSEEEIGRYYAVIRESMLRADLCFTTTEELAYHMRGSGKRTHVMPNGFDQGSHDLARRARRDWLCAKDDTLIRIGYAGGTRTHQRDFGCAVEAIARILHENADCRLVLFRTPDHDVPLIDVEEYPVLAQLTDRIEWRPLQPLKDLPFELARFDINIAPLEFGNPFCEAKSELKFWEAALVEVPTVASPTGPYRRAIAHGKTGFLAASADDWYGLINRLIADPELRRRMAREAYHSALAHFGPTQRALRLGRVIEQVRGGAAGARAFALEANLAAKAWHPPMVFPSDVVFEQQGSKSAEVTVIIPLYNYEGYIVAALDSVRQQTLEPLDLIVIDGCSTDNSLSVAKNWVERNASRFNRLLVLKNRGNYGLGFCRNSGFDAADTPYVLPLDADNKLLPACCETLLRTIRAARTAYVYPTIETFGNSSGIIGASPYDPQGFVAGNYIDAMALVAKEAWAMVGGYDHVRHGWEDYDFWCRFAELGLRGTWKAETLAQYRVHKSSIIRVLQNENYRRLFDNFSARHPWVVLGEQHGSRQLPALQPHLTAPGKRTRLDDLLSLLRCPETGQKLAFDASRTALVSTDGLRSWPILEGRPLLSRKFLAPEIRSSDPVASELPQSAAGLIRSTDGLVLHLNAGNSFNRFENVVEVDRAIFRHTDIVADPHDLPFDDESFHAVVVMNVLQGNPDPREVVAELHRVLKNGGRILVRSGFLRHRDEMREPFFDFGRNGRAEWLKAFDTEVLHVPEEFCPNHSIAWLASEAESALRRDVSATAAEGFAAAPVGELVSLWRDSSTRVTELWTDFTKLQQESQHVIAAGFEFIGRKLDHRPDLNIDGGGSSALYSAGRPLQAPTAH
jgi:glycosyltransferase involved in cell wall biosynthesis/SAM-dependent methyltransferase/uncharacterized protein YbaR (Trm112 family)